jgi:hypothetical protein
MTTQEFPVMMRTLVGLGCPAELAMEQLQYMNLQNVTKALKYPTA